METNKVRIEKIKERIKNTKKFDTLVFKAKPYAECPVIELDINDPYYRLNNTRTKRFQRQWLAENPNEDKNFFHTENTILDRQQTVQAELIRNHLQGKDLSALDKDFEKMGGQSEDLLMTEDGIMVNGNRRLCYMRDSKKYPTVSVLILPAELNERIISVESFLDNEPDSKVEYDWISKGELYHEMANGLGEYTEKMSFQDIADELTVMENDVKVGIIKYENAMRSLEIRGHKDKTDLLNDSEQIHKDCTALFLRKNKLQNEKEIGLAGLTLLDHLEPEGNSKYRVFKRFLRYPSIVGSVLSDELGEYKREDKFGEQEEVVGFSAEALKDLQGDDKTFDSNIDKIESVVDEIKRQITLKEGEEGDEEKAKKFLKNLKNSYDNINSAKLNLEPGSTLDNYEQILIDIENKIEDIKNEILSWKK